MITTRSGLAKIIARAYRDYNWTIKDIERMIKSYGCKSFKRIDATYLGFGRYKVK